MSASKKTMRKYLALVPTDESRDIQKTYEESWTKVRDLITSKTNNSDNYDKKYMKLTFNLDDDSPLKNARTL